MIVGGGDSALDWTLGLQDTADPPIALVHRRDRFRALESSVNEARRLEEEGRVRIIRPREVREVHGDGAIEAVTIENTAEKTSETSTATRSSRCSASSRTSARSPNWGLELEGKRQIKIDPTTCRTSMDARLRGGRRRRLPRQDHPDHDRHGRGRDRGQQRGGGDPRREGPAEVLDGLAEPAVGVLPESPGRGARRAARLVDCQRVNLQAECLRCGEIRPPRANRLAPRRAAGVPALRRISAGRRRASSSEPVPPASCADAARPEQRAALQLL